jgi:hypothetical protein
MAMVDGNTSSYSRKIFKQGAGCKFFAVHQTAVSGLDTDHARSIGKARDAAGDDDTRRTRSTLVR